MQQEVDIIVEKKQMAGHRTEKHSNIVCNSNEELTRGWVVDMTEGKLHKPDGRKMNQTGLKTESRFIFLYLM